MRPRPTPISTLRSRTRWGGTAPRARSCSPATAAARSLFPEPDHDAAAVSRALGSDSVAGFFAAGEIGPVGGRAFVHGYTATLAVFLESQ